jgi:hypothetical protein
VRQHDQPLSHAAPSTSSGRPTKVIQ